MKGFKKVNILSYVEAHKKELKKYKNVEKLTVIKELEERRKPDKKYYLCKNQNGREVVKSDFMLEYSYKNIKNDVYVINYNVNVAAFQVDENIEFANGFGERRLLSVGDYVVVDSRIVDGMKKEIFEENYKSIYKANKTLKAYNEEIENVIVNKDLKSN